MAKTDEKGNWVAPNGDSVPRKFVNKRDQRRDKLVEEAHKAAGKVAQALARFDKETRAAIDAYLEWASAEEGVKLNEGGNYTFSNFSGDKRVMIKVAEFISFDDRLQQAKVLIDECLDDWSEGGRDEIKVLVQDVFRVDSKGRLNARRVISLRKHKFKDPRWAKAMELISDSVSVSTARAYLMLQERPTQVAEWRTIRLDLSTMATEV